MVNLYDTFRICMQGLYLVPTHSKKGAYPVIQTRKKQKNKESQLRI